MGFDNQLIYGLTLVYTRSHFCLHQKVNIHYTLALLSYKSNWWKQFYLLYLLHMYIPWGSEITLRGKGDDTIHLISIFSSYCPIFLWLVNGKYEGHKLLIWRIWFITSPSKISFDIQIITNLIELQTKLCYKLYDDSKWIIKWLEKL